MMPAMRKSLVLLLAALPSAAFAAGKFTWFDDSATDASAVQSRPSAFGADVYTSAVDTQRDAATVPNHKVSVFGDYAPRAVADEGATPRFANFGVRWQHRVSSSDRLSVSAQQGDGVLPSSALASTDALDTRTTISWTRDLPWSWKPSITGGVFLGDESGRDDSARQFGRRYYGFTVGGELKLLQSHTPYVSFRMERSLYDLPENGAGATSGGVAATSAATPNYSSARSIDDASRLAAGWRWQVQRGWSMQAEASYGFTFDNGSSLSFQERDGSRLFFGTRFDFR